MKIGFTGTQKGMTLHQKEMVEVILTYHKYITFLSEVHHGNCIGADDEFNTISKAYCPKRVAHPASDTPGKQAHGFCETILPAKPALVRNHDIVDAVDIMIATPKERQEVLRSGTWATIRYCRSQEKLIHIIYP